MVRNTVLVFSTKYQTLRGILSCVIPITLINPLLLFYFRLWLTILMMDQMTRREGPLSFNLLNLEKWPVFSLDYFGGLFASDSYFDSHSLLAPPLLSLINDGRQYFPKSRLPLMRLVFSFTLLSVIENNH